MRNYLKKIVLVFCLTVSCFVFSIMFLPIVKSAQGRSKSDNLNSKIGIVYRDNKNNLKFEIPNEKLNKGTKIAIVTIAPQKLICCAKVVGISSSENQTAQKVYFDDNKKTSMYDLKFDSKKDVELGFGIIDSTSELREEAGKVIGDLNKDGISEYFRDCTGTEGVHLTIWSGKPLKGTKLWHAAFYLGYDVEPSCLEEDFK